MEQAVALASEQEQPISTAYRRAPELWQRRAASRL